MSCSYLDYLDQTGKAEVVFKPHGVISASLNKWNAHYYFCQWKLVLSFHSDQNLVNNQVPCRLELLSASELTECLPRFHRNYLILLLWIKIHLKSILPEQHIKHYFPLCLAAIASFKVHIFRSPRIQFEQFVVSYFMFYPVQQSLPFEVSI